MHESTVGGRRWRSKRGWLHPAADAT